MKKVIFMLVCVALLASGLPLLHAQESSGKKDFPPDKPWMMCKQKRMGGECCMGSMMQSMMSPALLETKDGGIIVMSGTKLMKYDKDLNLVKEAEVKMDVEGMGKLMKKIMENCPCPFHKEGMHKGPPCMKNMGSGTKE